MKSIECPTFSSNEIVEIVKSLKKLGHTIKYFIDENLQGEAHNIINGKMCEIRYRSDEKSKHFCITYHELLHLKLVISGYKRLYCDDLVDENIDILLRDIFEHIMIVPELKKAGCSIDSQKIAIIRRITEIEEGKLDENEDLGTLLKIFYIEAKLMGIDDRYLIKIKNYKTKTLKNWYQEDEITNIIKNFPKSNMSKEKYINCQEICLGLLNLQDHCEFC